MYILEHGGNCCGICHIAGFAPIADAAQQEHLDNLLRTYRQDEYDFVDNYDHFNILLEAVLTDQQMMQWSLVMQNRGFRIVNRFYNSNSGNYCNILHYCPHEPRGRSRRPRPY